ncbi:alkaline phosphatase D family protein [Microbulbifer thermotolerans]|uniref:alkaline phosphatase D family protein n=1 Tax=Microbulbifer thermotolerans TaxID=252514 RepID=UPI002248E7E6|nr:alkaline phosphatase D family protein [Microbulbifer thermotolerans]MCX2832358.1 alkaline phosphatase D family protein [Microbulbifer thermotolerans]
MKYRISRRDALKLAAGMAAGVVGCTSTTNNTQRNQTNNLTKKFSDSWDQTHDRIWVGGEYWANPMEDWRVVDGGVECVSTGGNRSIHSLTHQLVAHKPFVISVNIKRLQTSSKDGGAGIRVGVKSDINEYRSNCFVQQGLDAGIINNQLSLSDKKTNLSQQVNAQNVSLVLRGEPRDGVFALTLDAYLSENGQHIGQLSDLFSVDKVLGNTCIVSNFSLPSDNPDDFMVSNNGSAKTDGTRYRFSQWMIEGEAFNDVPEQKFGPILWAMYTLTNSRSDEGYIMKLSALTGPLGKKDNQHVELQIKQSGKWVSLATAQLDPDAWTATFRIANWNEKVATPYRLVYREKRRDGSEVPDIFTGTIQAQPVGRKLRMAALTCQNDYAFPYEPVANNVTKLKPDLILFSGDQIYENHGGFGVIRFPAEPAILNYLRKFYQFGWAFREPMRHAPTICLPDDHDVLQGNLWGEGGAKMSDEAKKLGRSDMLGGYIEPIRVLNVIHKTNTAHLPDPVDPTPSDRGLNVYYTEMVYGNISFAILADRQWKSGPDRLNIVVGETGQDEDPLYINPDFDREDLQLLGKRQEAFLEQWGNDWRDHTLKAVISQTVFAGISTHQPLPDRYLKYDFDSSGWPATARNRAIKIMRQSKALHICGDTHLATLSQYGVDKQRDSNWAFCTPAIAAGWPRWWRPDDLPLPHANRPSHGLSQTGEYLDSFGNKIYVYAAGNPEVEKSANRYIRAHEKGSGFGFITFDTEDRTYTMEAFRFLVDATDNNPNNQFPGWPLTIHQDENIGINKVT